jgi:hypothetical protein
MCSFISHVVSPFSKFSQSCFLNSAEFVLIFNADELLQRVYPCNTKKCNFSIEEAI